MNKISRKIKSKMSAIALLGIILILAVLFSLTVGRYGLKIGDIGKILSHYLFGSEAAYDKASETVLLKVRAPRILSAICIGAALSAAGATYQGLFRNPMVSPDLLGATSGACFGACISLLLNADMMQVQLAAFCCGLLAVSLTYFVSTIVSRGSNSTLSLVLTGMVVSSMFSAFMTVIKYVADPNSKLAEITFWLMGGLTSIGNEDLPVLFIPVVVGLIPIILLRYQLNVLSFGEDEAKSLGINTKTVRLIFIGCSTLVTSAAVAASGMIGWVGLVIPHLARMIVGPDYKTLLPVSLLLGASYLLMIDNISRCLFAIEIPLGVLTALIGAPFFLYLLMRGKKGWV